MNPGHAIAHNNLGLLLQNEREDLDSAEAAYCAAIAVNPGNADAHYNLGILLEERAQQIEESGGDLAKAATLYDECAQLWGVSSGADHEWTWGAQADAMRVRAAA